MVLAVGGVANFAGVEGAQQYTIPFRRVVDADALRFRMIETLDRISPTAAPQDGRSAATFVVVGAGASGVEVSTKMADLLNDAFQRRGLHGRPRVIVVEMSDRIVPGLGEDIRNIVTEGLRSSGVEVHTNTRVQRVTPQSIVFEHEGATEEVETAAVVWTGGVRVSSLIEKLGLEKDKRGLMIIGPTLQVRGRSEVFALGDSAFLDNVPPTLVGTSQLAFQQSSLAVQNVRAFLAGQPLQTKEFAELGEALSLGTERAAVMVGDVTIGGPLARKARFAMYTSRLPTWHHRLKVGASWFFEGNKPLPLGLRR
ncbi:MAG: FAD-dependent oxidoreductase [Pyrinomonadaceae bacterium]